MNSIDQIRARDPLPLLPVSLTARTIAVTGARGFIGTELCRAITAAGGLPIPLDIPDHDIMRPRSAAWAELPDEIDAFIHLAAHKDAPQGELYPAEVADVNIRGTANIVDIASRLGAPVILASTCKAADPCTAYGASKLVAERVVMNASGAVVRLVNVLASSGSVLQTWDAIPEDEPIPVTDCTRMFIDVAEACGLLLTALDLRLRAGVSLRIGPIGMGRNTPEQIAARAFPGREMQVIPLRRGDRQHERLSAESERTAQILPGIIRILDPWEVEADAEVHAIPVVRT